MPINQMNAVSSPSVVARAQAGDGVAREQLLQDYRPFYLRVASNCCRKYLVLGRDDEASIAMIAFNEAIDSFNSNGGSVFPQFCRNCGQKAHGGLLQAAEQAV